MAKILITGAGGFVGANLRAYFNRRDHAVSGFSHQYLDVRSVDMVETQMARVKPDWVFHCAAYGGVRDTRDHPDMIAVNTQGTINVVNAAKANGVKVLINCGSQSEYGADNNGHRINEVVRPNTLYGVSKLMATEYVRYMGYTTMRLATVYGPGEADYRFVPSMLKGLLRGQVPELSNPTATRDFIYIDDVCRAFELVAVEEHCGYIHNIGSGVSTTLQAAFAEMEWIVLGENRPRLWRQTKGGVYQQPNRVDPSGFQDLSRRWTPLDFTHGIIKYINELGPQ